MLELILQLQLHTRKMSKARLTYAGGKYAGKKIVDLLKSIKRVARNKKSKANIEKAGQGTNLQTCLLYTSPSPRDGLLSRMPSSA